VILFFLAWQLALAVFTVIPLLIVASIWYLVMTSIAYVIQYFVERRYARGFSRAERAGTRLFALRFRRREAAPL